MCVVSGLACDVNAGYVKRWCVCVCVCVCVLFKRVWRFWGFVQKRWRLCVVQESLETFGFHGACVKCGEMM